MIGVRLPEHARTTSMYFGGNSFIITPPFSPSPICVTSCGTVVFPNATRLRPFASA